MKNGYLTPDRPREDQHREDMIQSSAFLTAWLFDALKKENVDTPDDEMRPLTNEEALAMLPAAAVIFDGALSRAHSDEREGRPAL